MAGMRRKKGPVSGWIVLDKPVGMGSTEAVAKIKWLFSAQKAGHAGTLDPLASGMLPIALGEATKTVPYVMDGATIYHFTVAWGEERTTDDLEGEVVARSDTRPAREAILALLPRFTGVIQQVPPQFSAIKIGGERAYDLARDGETVDLPAREVEIERLEIVAMPDPGHTEFVVVCGKGTYVRSLARDMGRLLGCYGHVSSLRRTEVEPFTEEDFVSLEALEAASPKSAADGEAGGDFAALDALMVDTGAALDGLPHVALAEDAANRVRLGNPVVVRGRDAPVQADEAYATFRGKLIAIGEIEAGQFKPHRVFKG
jgi:tRNA pseudouridine55 synthase